MTLFSAPAGLTARALFYGQLGTMLQAGLPVLQILEQLARTPPERSLRAPASELLGTVRSGRSFTDGFRQLGAWVPAFDLALIEAGERSGRLDEAFQTLARHHRELAANLRGVVQECVYPALVLHAALFIVPLPALFAHGRLGLYLLQTFGVLGFLYGLIAAVAWALAGRRHEDWRAAVERLLLRLPVLGAARTDLALARLAGALHALLGAGVLVTEAWPLAATASGSPLLRRVVAAWPGQFAAGRTPGELVGAAGAFPELFASTYYSGEISGRLEEQLAWLARHHEQEGFARLRLVSQWLPRLFYGFIAVWIALQILVLAGGYVATLNQLLGE
jgi:type II secretory pathway component PulF